MENTGPFGSGCLRAVDVRAMLRLAHELHELPPDEVGRKKHFLRGLCALVGASRGLSIISDVDPATGEGKPLSTVEEGWGPARARKAQGAAPVQDGARQAVEIFLRTGEPRDPVIFRLHRRLARLPAGDLRPTRGGAGRARPGARTPDSLTRAREQVVRDGAWYASAHVAQLRRPAGIDAGLYSALRLERGDGGTGGGGTGGGAGGGLLVADLVLNRAWGDRRRFTPRDRAVVDVLHRGLDWLYRADVRLNAPADAALTARERQTLQYLLAGLGEKQAARRLGLSPNTVHHYVKSLYRHFGVTSRSELLAQWVRGGHDGNRARADE